MSSTLPRKGRLVERWAGFEPATLPFEAERSESTELPAHYSWLRNRTRPRTCCNSAGGSCDPSVASRPARPEGSRREAGFLSVVVVCDIYSCGRDNGAYHAGELHNPVRRPSILIRAHQKRSLQVTLPSEYGSDVQVDRFWWTRGDSHPGLARLLKSASSLTSVT